jgi:glycosyltransferase involved in cell wall biosynthesis
MRIVYIHQYFNTPSMSGGTRSYEMARRLVRSGHEVHMVTSARDGAGPRASHSTEAGIQVHWLSVPYSNHMSYAARIAAFLRFATAATIKAASIPCDVVFATSTPLTIAIPAVVAAAKRRVPMVFEVRDLWPAVPIALGALRPPPLRWAARRLERWAYRHAESVVGLSPGMRDGVIAAGYPAERVAVLPNASDLEAFDIGPDAVRAFRAERPWLGDGPIILYAGAFGRVNGVGWLVPVARHLLGMAPGARILLIGDGAERDRLEAEARAAGVLDTNLFIEGPLPKADIPAAFRAASLAANLTIDVEALQANSANKFFDALAAGTPVLLNNGGWQAELIERAGAGIVAWRVQPEEAAARIADALADPGWAAGASAAARRLAVERFDREVLAERLERLLEAATRRNGSVASRIAPWEPA